MAVLDRSKKEMKESRFLQGLMSLPIGTLLKVFRQKPVVIDGQTLDPEMQMVLILRKLKKAPGMGDRPPEVSRKHIFRDARVHGICVENIHSEDIEIPSPEGHSIKARLYQREHSHTKPQALLVFLHGGGFVLGDVESYDHICRFICEQASVSVFSVDYRLAPEHPFPSGINDSLAAYRWALANAQRLNADPERFAVGGDSAGANFATHIAQAMTSEVAGQPIFQWLIYPTADRTRSYPSSTLFADGFFLRAKDIDYFTEHYQSSSISDERVSPIHGKLQGLPPALIVTAGFDPLRDEGESYAEALKKAGNQVELLRFPGMIHGFINMIGFSPAAKKNLKLATQHLKDALHV